jgi:hypothetical protein
MIRIGTVPAVIAVVLAMMGLLPGCGIVAGLRESDVSVAEGDVAADRPMDTDAGDDRIDVPDVDAGDAADAEAEDIPIECPSTGCDDGNPCNGTETCNTSTGFCENGTPLEDGALCGDAPRRICVGGTCRESTCGDAYVDAGADEVCDGNTLPCTSGVCPGTQTCNGTCSGWGACVQTAATNDTCATAGTIPGSGTYTVSGTTCGGGDDDHGWCGGMARGPDVAYRMTISARSQVILDTCGTTLTSFDTVLYLYAGSCSGSGQVACNDDGCGGSGFKSRIEATLDPGVYFVIVDGLQSDDMGGFELQVSVTPVSPPANDVCSGAIDISAGGTFAGDTTEATNDAAEACAGDGTRGVWYQFTLPADRVVYLSTEGGAGLGWSDISVFRGTCSSHELAACYHEECGPRAQGAAVMSAGTYDVLLSGAGAGDYGPYGLTYIHDFCPRARSLQPTQSDATVTWPDDDAGSCAGNTGSPDMPYFFTLCDGTVTGAVFSLCADTSFDTVLYVRAGEVGSSCGGTELACDNDGCSASAQSLITMDLAGPGLFFVIVDGNGADGSYRLDVTF